MGMVDRRRQDRRGPEPALRANRLVPLADAPAVVASTLDAEDRLPLLPADITGPEFSGRAVEAHPPGVAQAIGPDFGPGAATVDEGVVRGNAIGQPWATAIDVDSQDRGKQVADILPRVVGIGRRGDAGVTGGNIEEAVRAESKAAPVVAPRRIGKDDLFARGVDPQRVDAARREPSDARAVGPLTRQRVAEEDLPVLGKPGMKRQAVERPERAPPRGEVEGDLGMICPRLVGEREDLSAELSDDEVQRAGHLGQEDGQVEDQVREGGLDGVRGRGVGCAGETRRRPGGPPALVRRGGHVGPGPGGRNDGDQCQKRRSERDGSGRGTERAHADPPCVADNGPLRSPIIDSKAAIAMRLAEWSDPVHSSSLKRNNPAVDRPMGPAYRLALRGAGRFRAR